MPLATISLPKVSDIFIKYHHHMIKQIHLGHLPFTHTYSKVLSIKYCIYATVYFYVLYIHIENCLFHSFTPYQYNTTPLYVASLKGHHDVVKTLLGAGADVNITRSDVSEVIFYFCCI